MRRNEGEEGMIITGSIAEVRKQVKEWKLNGLCVGLVPTMGYLHEGHASLIEKSVSLCDKTVASVFVNPTQFGPGEDLETYPRDFSHDCELLKSRGCNMVFAGFCHMGGSSVRHAEAALRKNAPHSLSRCLYGGE